ncbi:MAG TPA: right-handed parallel beta-helix repeat-containing protein [Pedobacter sp.]
MIKAVPFLTTVVILVLNSALSLSCSVGPKIGAETSPAASLSITPKTVIEQEQAKISPTFPNLVLYAKDFGLSATASAVENTKALQRISSKINALGGGVTLIFEKGIYTVGNEKLAGNSGKGFAYLGDTLLKFSGCTKPVVLEGNGATIKFASGLHFGSFHPVTGKVFKPTGAFYDYNYTAYPTSIIDARNNQSITIKNLNLDGNVQNLVLGGGWGDDGLQLPADGILLMDNREILVEKVTSNFFGRDGIVIGNTTPSENAPVKMATIINSIFDGNARQGFSWVGGNHLIVRNSSFINTGKTINKSTGQPARSSPAAGVDMEAEMGLIRNGIFENCLINNNDGPGLLTVGDVADMKYIGGKIVGSTMWSIYGSGPRMLFTNTTIVGAGVNLYSTQKMDDPNRTKFINCLLTLDEAQSPTGKVYGGYVMDFGGGASPHFINCTLDASRRSNVYGGNCIFENCTFTQLGNTTKGYNGYSFLVGTFRGTNRMTYPGGRPDNPNKTNSKFVGPFYINGVDISKQ